VFAELLKRDFLFAQVSLAGEGFGGFGHEVSPVAVVSSDEQNFT
jgi:hypothetical protein